MVDDVVGIGCCIKYELLNENENYCMFKLQREIINGLLIVPDNDSDDESSIISISDSEDSIDEINDDTRSYGNDEIEDTDKLQDLINRLSQSCAVQKAENVVTKPVELKIELIDAMPLHKGRTHGKSRISQKNKGTEQKTVRKEKLKKLAPKKSNVSKLPPRTITTPKVKNTLKNRGDFLTDNCFTFKRPKKKSTLPVCFECKKNGTSQAYRFVVTKLFIWKKICTSQT